MNPDLGALGILILQAAIILDRYNRCHGDAAFFDDDPGFVARHLIDRAGEMLTGVCRRHRLGCSFVLRHIHTSLVYTLVRYCTI